MKSDVKTRGRRRGEMPGSYSQVGASTLDYPSLPSPSLVPPDYLPPHTLKTESRRLKYDMRLTPSSGLWRHIRAITLVNDSFSHYWGLRTSLSTSDRVRVHCALHTGALGLLLSSSLFSFCCPPVFTDTEDRNRQRI